VKMWSGRFRQPLDPHFEEWQRSFPFDRKLLRYELAASRAHAQALKAAGIVTPAEFGLIAAALEEIGKTSEQQAGYFDDPEAEDDPLGHGAGQLAGDLTVHGFIGTETNGVRHP